MIDSIMITPNDKSKIGIIIFYGWKDNKGYPTLRHKESLKKYGIVDIHRKTFKLYDGQTLLDF